MPARPEQPVQDMPSDRLNPHVEDQNMEIKPTVMGPPAFGSPDPSTVDARLAPVVDHPRKAALSDDYGRDVIGEESNNVSTITGDEVGPGADSYEDMKNDELKALAKERGLENYSQLNKEDLVALHEDYDEAQAEVSEEDDDSDDN